MKIINAKILILIMFINMLLPLSAFAEGKITLYNHDEEVYLTNDIETYNNHYYISVEDLYELELNWKLSDSLYIESYYNDLIIYPETSIIELNGENLLFQNPMKDIGGTKYVSLDLIAMVFSGIYEITDNSIYLWINTGQSYTARGTISLPNGEVAPVGGVEILVFYGRKQSKSQGSGSNYSEDIGGLEIGYSGITKPTNANKEIEYSIYKHVEKYVTIPEGKNSVEYALGIPHVYSGFYLGYEVDTDTYKEIFTEKFYRNSGIINFEIYSNTVTLSGTVTLPEIAEKDVKFTVYSEVYTERMYSYDGIIPAGTNFAPYSMQVGQYDDYSMSVVFEDNEYKRIFKQETITVKDTEITNIDFETQKSNIVSGTLKLPDNMVLEEDIEATVTIQSRNVPYYYLDSKNIVIAAGDTSETFTLYDDMGCGSVICYYELQSDNDELFSFGHYNKTGTTVVNDNASKITFSENLNQNIEITLIKNTSVEVKINLPDGYVAESNIYGNIYLTTAYESMIKDSNMAIVSGSGTSNNDEGDDVVNIPGISNSEEIIVEETDFGEIEMGDIFAYSQSDELALMSSSGGGVSIGGGGASSKPSIPVTPSPLFKAGESTVTKTFDIPDDAYFKYNIILHSINDANDMFYDVTYYKGNAETTVFRECAKELTSSDNNIEITLMKQHKISGKIDTDVVCNVGMVYAIHQADSEINADVKKTSFKVLTEPNYHNNFELFVPDELDDYIFRFDIYGKSVYYSSYGLADNIADAEVVTVNGDTNIEILYEGFNTEQPFVITYTDINKDIYGIDTTIFDGYIQLKNISDYEYETQNLHIASYDENGRLLRIETLPTLVLEPHSYGDKYGLIKNIDKEAACVKIFVWSDNLKPLANSYEISNVVGGATVDYKNVYLWMQAGITSMYCRGVQYSLDVAPTIKNNTLYAPARAIAETFGACVEYDADTQIILITLYDKTIKIKMKSDVASVNGEEYQLKGQPIVINGRTLLPVTDLADIFEFNGEYISKSGEFVIYDSVDNLVFSAEERGIFPNSLIGRTLDSKLTRLELAEIIVALYEYITSEEIALSGSVSYNDTDDINVLKLTELGVMKGVGDGNFEPDRTVTKEQAVVMFQRALLVADCDVPDDYENVVLYSDDNSISEWAKSSIYKMKKYGALDNIFVKNLNPQENIDIRTAIAISENCASKSSIIIYTDINSSHPYYKAITELSKLGVINGYEDGTFKAKMTVTRAELSKLICNIANTDASTIDFSCDDVKVHHWASKYVGYCVLNNIIALEDDLYRPDDNATVIEVISAILNLKGFDGNGTVNEIVDIAEECGLLNNMSNLIFDEAITRGEIAQLLYNSLELDYEIYCQEKFLEMCNSGTYDSVLDAMDSELYHYSLCPIIKSLDYDAKKEIAKIIYSKCTYFDSIDTFNMCIEISYNEWKSANNKPSAGGGGGRGDSSGSSSNIS